MNEQNFRKFKPGKFIFFATLFLTAVWALFSAILMFGWNALAPAITVFEPITFTQALTLSIVFFVIGRILRGWRRPRYFKNFDENGNSFFFGCRRTINSDTSA